MTRPEQRYFRDKLARVKCEIEPRIAATIATRDPTSPFYNMVNVRLEGAPPGNATPYIPESAIRYLIEGGGDMLGWRTDDDFYDYYVKPTFPDRAEWESWTTGEWVGYWFKFWEAVRDFYNEQAKKWKKDDTYLLWDPNN